MASNSPNYPNSPPGPSRTASSNSSLGGSTKSGGMVLYRLASENDFTPSGGSNRNSALSHISDSASLLGGDDNKYPVFRQLENSNATSSSTNSRNRLTPHAALFSSTLSSSSSTHTTSNPPRGFVPYEYDPLQDSAGPADEEDYLHDPKYSKEETRKAMKSSSSFDLRGFWNVGMLVLLVVVFLGVFLVYPIIDKIRLESVRKNIANNIHVNASGQSPLLTITRSLVDPDTPQAARTRTGFDGQPYTLVYSDEFELPGRTFFPGEDPYLEAVDLWYGVTADMEWYDPGQVITRDGALVITMDTVATQQPNLTPGSTAPFTVAENHNLSYRSGMLQSWNKFCFTSGYIEVSVILPGNAGFDGLWPGAWTMGNLGRPGYRASTDAMWPYSYDDCDIGTFPNQTAKGAPPNLLPGGAWPEYDSKFNALNGQRLSSCTCPNSDHPGPWGKFEANGQERYRGRGVPEIDILEVQKDANGPGNVASQSGQYAPFTQGYQSNPEGLQIFDSAVTVPNGWPGSPLQQAVSALTQVPLAGHQHSPNKRYVTYGFEYWANPNNRDEGFITWQVDGKPTVKQLPIAMGPDKGPGGMGAGQRLIPEEPMSIIINLGISNGWAPPKFETLSFPAEMSFDYIRVYQREGSVNVGCDPKDYPTADYINKHLKQYTDLNLTRWEDGMPRNRLYEGSC
ncbi:beta-glucan synthesis-associated [Marasmius fiardii PR-910]|nr:beta-glucan synthesis-associated [Marasmius fiardii PR-910]